MRFPRTDRRKDFRRRIRTSLIAVYVTPVVIIELLFVLFFYMLARDALDKEMGRRLVAVARSVAEQVPPEAVLTIVPGDEKSRGYRELREKLDAIALESDVARAYVFDREQRSLVDSSGAVAIGSRYHKLVSDRRELEQVAVGRAVASTLFTGADGRLYKSGYAPLREGGEVVATVAVDASVTFFETIREIRDRLLLFGAGTVLLIVGISLAFARRIERPLGELVRSARRIGEGDMDQPIAVSTPDEIGFLARTMEEMRERIVENTSNLVLLQRGIAHEVRNPLGGMALFADLLLDELTDDSQREHVRKIQKELASLNRVVSGFLDYTRQIVPEVRDAEAGPLLQDAVALLAGEAENRGVRIVADGENDLVLRVDPDLIQSVLINVLTNAVQASPPGGTVAVAARREDGQARIDVTDGGPGVPEDRREAIFRPFYTTKDRGSGLGLAIARKLCELHGGSIRASGEPGAGATLTILLPLSPGA